MTFSFELTRVKDAWRRSDITAGVPDLVGQACTMSLRPANHRQLWSLGDNLDACIGPSRPKYRLDEGTVILEGEPFNVPFILTC